MNEAVRRRHISENPALLARAPEVVEEEVEPYSVEEIKRLLEAAQTQRNSARWAIALALGLRQGEVLGLQWPDIDQAACALTVRRSRLRPKWKHGCSTPCGHQHGGHCPQRVPLRDETGSTTSKAGNRIIGLPDELVTLPQRHHIEQDRERTKPAQLWHETGYVFTTPTGRPLNQMPPEMQPPTRTLGGTRSLCSAFVLLSGGGSGGIRTPGWSPTARFQALRSGVRGQPRGVLSLVMTKNRHSPYFGERT